MKALALLLALVACVNHGSDPTVDAGYQTAQPDASFPRTTGCTMGNLPFSRTVTLTPDDPVPSELLNELQDRDIEDAADLVALDTRVTAVEDAAVDKAEIMTMTVSGDMFCVLQGAPVKSGVGGQTWSLPFGGQVEVSLQIPVGWSIKELSASFNMNGASGDLFAVLAKAPFGTNGAQVDISSVVTTPGGGWAVQQLPTGGGIGQLPYVVEDNYYIHVRVGHGGSSGGNVLFDGIRYRIQRPQ